jgi:anti-sigma B factor antagonist
MAERLTDRTYEEIPGEPPLETSTRTSPATLPSSIQVSSDWGRGGLAVVSVSGEVDAFSAATLRRELLSVIATGARVVVVDLDATTFVDSVTLGVLLGALRRLQARNGELRIACTEGPIRRTFELTQLDHVLPLFGSLGEALPPARG